MIEDTSKRDNELNLLGLSAYYDRRADMQLVTVYGYLMHLEYEKATPILDDTWATPEAVTEAARGIIRREQESVELWSRDDVAARQPEYAAGRVAEANESIAWAEALIAAVGA